MVGTQEGTFQQPGEDAHPSSGGPNYRRQPNKVLREMVR